MAAVHDFIGEALKAGHSMDSIISDLSKSEDKEEQAFAKNWLETASKPEYAAGGSETSLAKTITPMLNLVNEYPKTTLGVIGGFAATTAGVKAYNAYQDRKMKREAHESELEKNRAYAKQVELSAKNQAPSVNDIIDQTKQMNKKMTLEEANARLQGVTQPVPDQMEMLKQRFPDIAAQQGQKVAPPANVAPQAVAPVGQSIAPTLPGAIANQPAGIPQVNPQFTGQPAGNIPPAPPMLAPNVETAVATGGNVDQAIKQTVAHELDKATGAVSPEILRTGTGREVVAGQGPVPQRFAKEYKSPADVPKGFAFVPGAQYIDVLRNDLGQGTYTQQFTSKDFPGTYSEAVETGKNINRELNRPTREQLKAQGAAMPETTEGIVRKVGPSKLVKVGGVAGALISVADIAKAENSQQRREAVGNALLGLLPPGMDASALNANETAKLQQLFAKQAYAQQVGGGRGVAPPSMYPQGGLNYNSPRIR